jgi:hypothetical protein
MTGREWEIAAQVAAVNAGIPVGRSDPRTRPPLSDPATSISILFYSRSREGWNMELNQTHVKISDRALGLVVVVKI